MSFQSDARPDKLSARSGLLPPPPANGSHASTARPPRGADNGPAGLNICGADRSFDHYARLVRRLLGVPAAVVTIVEPHRQVFPGACGLPESLQTSRESPLQLSFCRFVVDDERPLAISDARSHPRFMDHPAVDELGVVAYAGWPVVDEHDRTVGALGAVDSSPRTWASDDLEILQDLAWACSAELQQSRRNVDDAEGLASAIFASSSVAMAFYDSSGRLVLANDLAKLSAAAAGFRLDQAPYAGEHVYRLDARTRVPAHDQFIPRALRGDCGSTATEWWGPAGNQISLILSAQPVLRADDTSWGTLIGAHDVTHLARALQMKDAFLADVSHELRTPLTPILAYVELLTEELGGKDGFVTGALDAIQRGARTLQSRVEELIESGAGDGPIDPRPTDVTSLAQAVAVTFGDVAERGGVTLCVECEAPCVAVVDPDRIRQAMESVVSNAVAYTGSGGRVNLSVTETGTEVRVAVSDTGIGMTQDEIAQAFNAFWRGTAARRGAFPGLGLGLTRVRDVMASHRGSAEIVSEPGRGTCVVLTIPRDVMTLED